MFSIGCFSHKLAKPDSSINSQNVTYETRNAKRETRSVENTKKKKKNFRLSREVTTRKSKRDFQKTLHLFQKPLTTH